MPTDEKENPIELIKLLAKEVVELRAKVEAPDSGLLERVQIIEDQQGAPQLPSLAGPGPSYETPAVLTDFIDESDEQEPVIEDLLPFQIEFGKPTANVTTDVATVTMQPCAEDGTSFASAGTVTVYVANDRQTQDTKNRGWTTASVLSFIRFSPWVAGVPIEGVLIGETLVNRIRGDGETAGTKAAQAGISSDAAEWIQIEYSGGFLRGKHCPPGPSCYTVGTIGSGSCSYLTYLDLDELGHVRVVAGFGDAPCFNYEADGPDA